jgi:hypothetical protein
MKGSYLLIALKMTKIPLKIYKVLPKYKKSPQRFSTQKRTSKFKNTKIPLNLALDGFLLVF